MDKELINKVIKNSDDNFYGCIIESKRSYGMNIYHMKMLEEEYKKDGMFI